MSFLKKLFGPPNVEKLQQEGNIEGLIKALDHQDPSVRKHAAEALDKLGWQPDENETGAAYWIARRQWDMCVEIGTPAVEPLIAALKDEDEHVRGAAADALGQIGDARVVEPLSVALKDMNKDVRKHAAEALGKIGLPEAIESLIAALEDSDTEIRQVVADALGQRNAEEAQNMFNILNSWNFPAHAEEISDQIGGVAALEPLINILNMRYEKLSLRAATLLGRLGDERAVAPLIQALEDRELDRSKFRADSQFHRLVAEALGDIGDNKAVDVLIRTIEAGDHRAAVIGAARALGNIGDPRAAEPLAKALDKALFGATSEYVKALGKLGDKRASGPLMDWYVENTKSDRGFYLSGDIKEYTEIFLKLGDDEALDLVRDVYQKNEVIREFIETALTNNSIEISDFLSASRAEPKTSLFAFFARATGGPQVLSTSDQEAWVQRLREEFNLPDAQVTIFREDQWDAPPLHSIDDEAIQKDLVNIQNAIQKALLAQGVPTTALDRITSDIVKLANPLTRLVIFAVKYTDTSESSIKPSEKAVLASPNVEQLKAKGDVKGLVGALGYKDVSVRRAAIKALEEVFGTAPLFSSDEAIDLEHPDTRVLEGRALIQFLQFDQALLTFQTAVDKGSTNPDGSSYLEVMYELQGDLDKAAEMKRISNTVSPGTHLAGSARDRIEMAYNYKLAMAQEQGVSDAPSWQEVQGFREKWSKYQGHLSKGTSLGQSRDLNGAIAEFKLALECFDGDLANAYIGGCMLQQDKYPEALSFLSKAIDRNPNCATAYFNRIIANRGLGNRAAAMNDYQRLKTLDPNLATRAQKYVY